MGLKQRIEWILGLGPFSALTPIRVRLHFCLRNVGNGVDFLLGDKVPLNSPTLRNPQWCSKLREIPPTIVLVGLLPLCHLWGGHCGSEKYASMLGPFLETFLPSLFFCVCVKVGGKLPAISVGRELDNLWM